MTNRSLNVLLCLLIFVPLNAMCASDVVDTSSPEQVITAFQKLPPYELYCEDEKWGSAEAVKVGAKFKTYLSKELNRLFMWSQCGEPELPPFYVELNNKFLWDIRFGFENAGLTNAAKNIRIRPAKYQGPDKAIVKLLFDLTPYNQTNITTTYTLIREDGHWKIDDIAPKGDFKPDDENYDAALEHSDSIKTDMQNNYRAAEGRYKQEQAKKGAAPKP